MRNNSNQPSVNPCKTTLFLRHSHQNRQFTALHLSFDGYPSAQLIPHSHQRILPPLHAIPSALPTVISTVDCYQFMRRGFSPSKSRLEAQLARRDHTPLPVTRPSLAPSPDPHRFFCHYNNALYMGGMDNLQRHGRGILLHDDGSSAVTEYSRDVPVGHNIIFRENSITSVLFVSSTHYEIAYKVGRVILKVPFADASHRAHGNGVLIDYEQRQIYELVFRGGSLVGKILHLDRQDSDDVFSKNVITRVIGMKHEQAFDLTFDKPDNLHVKLDSSNLTIGFHDPRGDLHGLAFKMYAENLTSGSQKSVYLKSLERGYYRQSRLQTYGEKYFSNGNKYMGEFSAGEFHGLGILLCPSQMKWVYGHFQRGKLTEVVDSNNKKYTENDFQVWADSLRELHRGYKERWIDLDIELPDELYLYKIAKDALQQPVTEIHPDGEEMRNVEGEQLDRLQSQFQQGYPGNVGNSYVEGELDRHYDTRNYGQSDRRVTPNLPREVYVETPKSSRKVQFVDNYSSRGSLLSSRGDPRDYETIPDRLDRLRTSPSLRQNQFRLQDPFYETLTPRNVPTKDYYDEPPLHSERRYSPTRYREPLTRVSALPEDIDYRYSRIRSSDPLDGVYSRRYLENYDRQRDRLSRLTASDHEYLDNIRRELSKSPIHRDYYDRRPYDRTYPRRSYDYPDKTYPDLTHYERGYPDRTRDSFYPRSDNYDPENQTLRPSPRRKGSPGKLTSSPKKNFIRNNYQHWN